MRKKYRTSPPPVRRISWRRVVFLGMVLVAGMSWVSERPGGQEPAAAETEYVPYALDDTLKEQIRVQAQIEGIEEKVNDLYALVMVESGGSGEDVFQASESLGLKPDSLSRDESIQQGVRYYAQLLNEGSALGADQDCIFQAYNYGKDFLYYAADRGGIYSFEMAQEYAAQKADHARVDYNNPIAVSENGGWRYAYGNMFYVQLIHQALDALDE